MFYLNYMDQKGVVAPLLVLLLLLAGLLAGLYLVQNRTNLLPKASVSGPITPTTSFILSPKSYSFRVGDVVPVKLNVRSDISAANLFTAKINFDKDLLVVDSIEVSNTFIKNWVEKNFDNKAGTISLIGGVPNPGFQTNISNPAALMALIHFKAVKAGTATISFADSSAIYSNAGNINILVKKQPINLLISGACIPRPTCLDSRPACKLAEPAGGWCPVSSPAPFKGTCSNNIGKQSPDAGDACVSCISTQRPGLSKAIYNLNPPLFVNCSDRELINYWCNGGISEEANGQCASDKAGPCVSVCSSNTITPKKATLSLSPVSGTFNTGCNFSVNVNVDTGGARTDGTDAMLLYDATKLTATSITNGKIYKDYPADDINTQTGKVIISGLAPAGSPFNGKGTLASVNFAVLPTASAGTTQIKFDFDPNNKDKTTDSNVVENGTVRDVLDSVVNGSYTIGTGDCNSQSSGNQPGSGDANADGKVDLSDLSVLLSDLNKTSGFKKGSDMNGDGVINTLDFSLMRNLLIQKGVIKGS